MSARQIIDTLQLIPHPEGGFFRETYRTPDEILIDGKQRNISTTIYYMLTGDDKSHLHRVGHDEIWYFHQGNPIELVLIVNNHIERRVLGNDIQDGQIPQLLVPANTWFAARIREETGYALVSCSVSPGFDFADFELAGMELLSTPELRELADFIR